MIDFQVYQGPGNRIVAISTQPVGEQWTVKEGTQGTRLRLSQWPTSKYPTLDSIKSILLPPNYVFRFAGHVDMHGNCPSVSTEAVLFWEMSGADVEALRTDLLALHQEMSDTGVTMGISDDAIGLLLSGPGWKFGVTARPQQNCIAAQTGCGAGTLVLRQAPEFLALLCALASRHPLSFADKEGNAVTAKEALALGARYVPTALAPFVKKRGMAPLSLCVKTAGRPRICF